MIRTGYRNQNSGARKPQKLLVNPVYFSIKVINGFLQIIGRTTYKSFFLFLRFIFNSISKLIAKREVIVRTAVRTKNAWTSLPKKAGSKSKNQPSPLCPKNNRDVISGLKFVTAASKLISNTKKALIKFSQSKLLTLQLPEEFFSIFIIIFLSSIGFVFYVFILKGLPSPNQLITRDQVVSSKIYDRNGRLLYTFYNGNQKRTLTSLEQLPQYLIQATIAIEDQTFWQHPGFSVKGIVRAIERNLLNQSLQGGSTITQQLVKNALLTSERTLARKIKEVLLAIQVELLFSKKEILQMYFNEIPYGGTAYGVEEASQTYFGKSAQNLNLAEAAMLAGLPAAPTKFSPFGANPQLAFLRQHQVLEQMVENRYISAEESEKAKKTKLVFRPQKEDILAPHFVMYVKDLLVEKYGTKRVEQGGLEVITSLNLDVQKIAEQELGSELNKLTSLHVTNGAVLVTKPSTGEVLAMVGSKDYFDTDNDGNVNVTTRLRQPGSSIKPINYAVAFQSGFSPGSIILDAPIAYRIPGSPPYAPVNYDNRFHGNISLRTALASSYNVPAVKLLATNGINKMIDLAEDMGISTWKDRSRYGLSLTLGGGEVKMTDLAVVYGTLANQGLRVDLHPILQVKNYKNQVLQKIVCDEPFNLLPQAEAAEEEILCDPQPVLNPLVAFQLTSILSDNLARSPAFGVNSLLNIPNHQTAVKTGTTNDKRDNWTIGYTPDFLTAVWVGNNDNSPMSAVASGITGASPIWHNTMVKILEGKPQAAFAPPPNLKAMSVCSLNGLLPCDGCPTVVEYFIPGTEPAVHCNMEQWENEKKEGA